MAARGWLAFRVPIGMPQQVQMDPGSFGFIFALNGRRINRERGGKHAAYMEKKDMRGSLEEK